MLTFEEKLAIIETFPQLDRKDVSLKRVNFHLEENNSNKTNIVYHLHPNGNGFVYAGYLKGYQKDDKGMVNIRDFSEEELRTLLEKTIRTLTWVEEENDEVTELPLEDQDEGERWTNYENHTLIVLKEDDTWNIYSGVNLVDTFFTYEEVEEYMREERFRKTKKKY